ncbi:hypothetical protein Tco_0699837 [Tanacetum coccineum]
METKDTLSSCSNSEEQQMQQTQDKAKESCMVSFLQLNSHLKLLSNNNLNGTRTESGFKRAFATLFGQDIETSVANDTFNASELDLLFGPLYDEFFNDGTSRVNKSSSPTDNSIQKDTLPSTHIQPTSEPTTPTNVHAEENNDNQAEFTNPLCTPVQENAESSSRNIGTSNMHTFNQPQDSEYRWTKDHPFATHRDIVEPKNLRRNAIQHDRSNAGRTYISLIDYKSALV